MLALHIFKSRGKSRPLQTGNCHSPWFLHGRTSPVATFRRQGSWSDWSPPEKQCLLNRQVSPVRPAAWRTQQLNRSSFTHSAWVLFSRRSGVFLRSSSIVKPLQSLNGTAGMLTPLRRS